MGEGPKLKKLKLGDQNVGFFFFLTSQNGGF